MTRISLAALKTQMHGMPSDRWAQITLFDPKIAIHLC